MKRPMIYVAGPLSKGVVALNIRTALETAEILWKMGYTPIVPHLTHFWNCMIPHEDTRHKDSFWMAYDFATLEHCDLMYRIPGDSIGADMEEDFCREHGIRIIKSMAEAQTYIETEKGMETWKRMIQEASRE